MRGAPDIGLKEIPARRTAERRIEGRVLLAGALLSIALHAAAILFITFPRHSEPRVTRGPAPVVINMEPVMRAFDITSVAVEVAPIEMQLEERRRPVDVPQVPQPWPTPAAGTPPPPRTDPAAPARDRLQYRMGSAEVWRPPGAMPAEEPSADDVVRARVAAQLREYNDSVAGEAADRARATDWTVPDGSGGKWGVSPGAIHLGSVTLPLPFALGTPPGRRDEIAGRVRSWTEIQEQAARAEGREVFDDRVRAIRERTERERARRNEATTGGSDPR
jgi:hypothetical protein